MELEKYETDVLIEHTRRRRADRQGDNGKSPPSRIYPVSRNKEATDHPEDDTEIICVCGMRHDDGRLVQCDSCRNKQHKICYYSGEADRIPEFHYCIDCQPRLLDKDQAKERQTSFLNRYRAQKDNLED